MTKNERRIYNAAIEQAAQIAAPDYQKANPGKWAKIRIDIAERIRACKVGNGDA